MKKVIIKTAIITLAVLIVVSSALFGLACLFLPASMRDFFRNAGNYQTAITFAERACENNETPENLKNTAELAIIIEDTDKIITYCQKLLNSASNSEITLTVDYVYYIAGEYAVALCAKQNFAEAITLAFNYSAGYGKLNPCENLIFWGINNNERQLLVLVLQNLNEFKQTNYESLQQTAKERLDTDIKNLTDYLNK